MVDPDLSRRSGCDNQPTDLTVSHAPRECTWSTLLSNALRNAGLPNALQSPRRTRQNSSSSVWQHSLPFNA